ncbi:MAG: thioredoxin [Eubacteriales bacterium]|nr:thioredoxin [Eubacteriales bacterium]
MTLELTDKNFQTEVLENKNPVLVDFWASWCGPCRATGPIVDQLAENYEGKLVVGKVNVDDNQPLAERYKVMSIPTLIIFKNGEIVKEMVGARPYDELAAEVDKVL